MGELAEEGGIACKTLSKTRGEEGLHENSSERLCRWVLWRT